MQTSADSIEGLKDLRKLPAVIQPINILAVLITLNFMYSQVPVKSEVNDAFFIFEASTVQRNMEYRLAIYGINWPSI